MGPSHREQILKSTWDGSDPSGNDSEIDPGWVQPIAGRLFSALPSGTPLRQRSCGLWSNLSRGQLEVATADRALCDRVANVVNELNALDTVEFAFAIRAPVAPPSLPFLTQASDIAPTTVAFSPPHLR